MTVEIKVPTLGESVTEATVAKWFKSAGDQVVADEPLVELETDKVTLEVPAPVAGKLESIAADEGATVEVSALLGAIAEGEAGAVAAPPPAPPPAPAPTPAPVQAAPPAPSPAPAAAAALSPA
ncbi:MAG: dihydrolipoamide succinyltransferase, partial [Alphaproteobacteria bacterium]|nr:dihydrolipoamide succinyltransferase [Alphaproteobacteria bacterium]